mmetsp:Transcript_14033/g.37204  ORF Transcript_14033/g.37204 Transcript_14033/m.37204 type:complete len:302 (-) Transcript_14033:286-1191(-)
MATDSSASSEFTAAYEKEAADKSGDIKVGGANFNVRALAEMAEPNQDCRQYGPHATKTLDGTLAAAQHADADVRVLDVGCSGGSDLRKMANLRPTARLYGIDMMGAVVELAKELGPATADYRSGDVHALPYQDDFFDAVYCQRLLIHSKQLERALKEIIRVLRPGGVCVMAEGDLKANCLHSDDERLQKVDQVTWASFVKRASVPRAAPVVYQRLVEMQSEGMLKDVAIEALPMLTTDFESADAGLAITRQVVGGLVATGDVSQEDADYYVDALLRTPGAGTPIASTIMFFISFTKLSNVK